MKGESAARNYTRTSGLATNSTDFSSSSSSLPNTPPHPRPRWQRLGSLPQGRIENDLSLVTSFRDLTPASPGLDDMPAPACRSSSSFAFLGASSIFSSALVAIFALVAISLPLPAEAFTLQDVVGGIEAAVAAAGPLGPALFIAAYTIATVFLVPASLLTLAAGFLFGPILGSAIVSLAATLGATAAFLVGRYLARPTVARRAAADTRFAAVDRAIADQGAKIVLLLRLSPLVPFSLLNYALSLTNIPLGSYIWASWAGMLPGTIAYVALGGAGKAAAETAAGAGTSPVQLVLYAVGALATLGATVLISRAAGQALKEASQLEEPLQGGTGGEGGGGGAEDPPKSQ